jgi:glycerol-3-phosphate acyltransferase PlsY
MSELVIVLVGGYLLGSVPFAYLIVRLQSRSDVRDDGSGNAGAYNAYIVTQSKFTGLVVGILDALKGMLAVYLAGVYAPGSFLLQCLGLLGAVGGHVFPIWTRFKGGRGLATTAGGMFILGFSYTMIWCTLWALAKLLRREILESNMVAILITPFLVWLLPWEWLDRLNLAPVDRWTFVFFSCAISFVLLGTHLDALKDIWKGSPEPQEDHVSPS